MVYSFLASGDRRFFTAHATRAKAVQFLIDRVGSDRAPHLHLSRDGQYIVDSEKPLEAMLCVFDTEQRARDFVAANPFGATGELERSLCAAIGSMPRAAVNRI